MIYVSSICFNGSLNDMMRRNFFGFPHVELTGNIRFSRRLVSDLLKVKKELSLQILLHNYVPFFRDPYVINLGSTSDAVYIQSIKHISKALLVTKHLGAHQYGFHAGYYCNMQMRDFGRSIQDTTLTDSSESLRRFITAYKDVKERQPGVTCYVENNVLTTGNYRRFHKQKPFMLLTYEDYLAMSKHTRMHLLLDIGHLKITCRTLSLDFKSQLRRMLSVSEYVHISDNDGKTDSNRCIDKNSEIWDILQGLPLKGKTITLEMKAPLNDIRACYQLFSQYYE